MQKRKVNKLRQRKERASVICSHIHLAVRLYGGDMSRTRWERWRQ